MDLGFGMAPHLHPAALYVKHATLSKLLNIQKDVLPNAQFIRHRRRFYVHYRPKLCINSYRFGWARGPLWVVSRRFSKGRSCRRRWGRFRGRRWRKPWARARTRTLNPPPAASVPRRRPAWTKRPERVLESVPANAISLHDRFNCGLMRTRCR